MKLLILGGSGFLSGTLARLALSQGHDVSVLTRGQRALPEGVKPILVDRKDRAAFSSTLQNVGEHWDMLADCICFTPEDAEQDIEVFSGLTDHLIFVSTDSVYQEHPRPFPVSEAFEQFTKLPYGQNKRKAEEVFLTKGQSLNWTILRPGHIYGPGSELGCLPEHSRNPDLLEHLKAGKPLRLVGGGHFLQMPVFSEDLARMILDCAGKPSSYGQIFNAPGPDIIPSWRYYEIIAEHLGVELEVEEVMISDLLAREPARLQFCSHRVYSTEAAQKAGVYVPDTPVETGLKIHVDAKLEA
ncbi:MAG: NAD-dependent epimerase/dehydratase family protein [Trueperaceae bacterium]|nr:NAD-dependent epimerase/dehydratase family protein [Trueperaceae bacterium]